jgi:uncharacterized membrane protein YidH (DUF202 family)
VPAQNEDEPPEAEPMQRMLDLSAERTRLTEQQTRLTAQQSEMGARRNYLAVERTLSVWIRTALALITLGVAVDRFGLLAPNSAGKAAGAEFSLASAWGGAALVAFGVLVAAVTGARFALYGRDFRRSHTVPPRHGPFLAPSFAALTALFGIGVLILLLAVG